VELSALGWLDRQFAAAISESISRMTAEGTSSETSPVNKAIVELDGALSELSGLSGTTSAIENFGGQLSMQEAQHVVYGKIPRYEVVSRRLTSAGALENLRGEFFTSLIDPDFLVSISQIISSPHVKTDPAVQVVYHNLLFHAYLVGGFETRATAWQSYLQCLRSVKEWRHHVRATTMDLVAGGITTWTAIQNFDYDFAWESHIKTCEIARTLDVHRLDVTSSSTSTTLDEDYRNKLRWGFWTLVVVDLFFQLLFDKPSCISAEASPDSIKMPISGDLTRERPRACVYATQIVWGRLTFIVKSFFVARSVHQADPASIEYQVQVDSFCDEIQAMLEDWRFVSSILLNFLPIFAGCRA
jgi:hypothetical protein